MKYSGYFIPTLREAPGDAVITSHILMLRAGMIRRLSNGLFAYLPLGLRSLRKLEKIIREEMDLIGAIEIKPTVITPGEFWKESGRWNSMGEAMLRVKNRLGADFVVSPTAEEAFTAIIRDELSSYKQLPLNLYQINTKYRDEIRPRYGVMRGREFIMHDAYSFNADEASLDKTYRFMEQAYRRIFKRCGLSIILVKADSGAMGGAGSEEFMVESEIGDNTLIICPKCGYAANVEKAFCSSDFTVFSDNQTKKIPPVEKIDTPHVKTIAELCNFLNAKPEVFIKTLIYRAINVELDLTESPGCQALEHSKLRPDDPPVYKQAFFAVCIRGDIDVNETKLAAVLKAAEVLLASDDEVTRITGAPVGFAGPVGLAGVPVIADKTVTGIIPAITGANEQDKHYKNVVMGRDFTPFMIEDLRTVKAGDKCALCGETLYEKKGNELGHIFKLGKKYTDSMHVNYLDETGISKTPVMGCYGMGLDRTLASIIEEHHDQSGIIWPVSLAPFEVIIIPVNYQGNVKDAADTLYAELEKRRIETLLDDRSERPGVRFNDADITGIPYRIVIGEKNLSQNPPLVEIKKRAEKDARLIKASEAADFLAAEISSELNEFSNTL
jgi:prolyl-tRNA synthetase